MSTNFFKISKGISFVPQSTDPSTAAEGDTYYNSTLHVLRQYQNGAWATVGGGSSDSVNIITTAAGTTSLAANTTADANLGKDIQIFTGTLAQIVKLPNATAMTVGQKIELYNESSSAITIQFNDASAFSDAGGISYTTLAAHSSLVIKVQTNTTADGTWCVLSGGSSSSGGGTGFNVQQPTVQRFLTGSGTYTTPANVAYITVEMVGGGGGGSGSGTSASTGQGNGGTTTFGTSLLTATGGSAGSPQGGNGGAGGTATVTSPATSIVALPGTTGQGSNFIPAGTQTAGAVGGTTPFGGNGGGEYTGGAIGATANTGAGGSSGTATGGTYTGSAGGSGAYIKAQISNPLGTYSYSVGTAGTAGSAGTSGFSGAAGGSGVIVVTEYYLPVASSGVTMVGSQAPTKQIFTTGSGTYFKPANVQYIAVRMVGGGGAGGAGNANGSSGNGTATTFGSSLLSAGGGTGGGGGNNGTITATGGTGSLGTGPIGFTIPGGTGNLGATQGDGNAYSEGGIGGGTYFGPGGVPGAGAQATPTVIPNIGVGGGGGGTNVSGGNGGSGGGGGAYIEATIQNPSNTYAYSIGTGGTPQAAGSNGLVGVAGSTGFIEVTEYYNVLASQAAGSFGYSTTTPTITKLLSGTGTYVPPSNCAYIEVEMVGGGGGSSGSSSNASSNPGGTGGDTTFGTSLLVAHGGTGGSSVSVAGGLGGTATITLPAFGTSLVGGGGQGNSLVNIGSGNPTMAGGMGGSNPLGGAGAGGGYTQDGIPGATNTGAGGGGPGSPAGTNANNYTGSGGGAGGYLKAVIVSPVSVGYAYSVGAAGTAGPTGSGGKPGQIGGSGVILVREYYNNTVASGVTVTASTPPTKQVFLSGSGTYNRPNGVQYITVKMVGGGAGGQGSGTSGTQGIGTNGGATTFGTSLLSAGGGTANGNPGYGGGGGSSSLGTGPAGIALTGGEGSSGGVGVASSTVYLPGGSGGSTPFGGSGTGGSAANPGSAAVPNTGSGGGGGATIYNNANDYAGGGGGAGGYIEAVISNPSATYAYSVGTAGAGGAAGTGGTAGGAGSLGLIEVTEYYTAYATGAFTGGGANVPTVQKFLSGSGTYTTPANVTYIQVEMVGGGAGGTGNSAFGGSGGTTSFGSSLLTATGGTGGNAGSPGVSTIGIGPLVLVSLPGQIGQTGTYSSSAGPDYSGGTGGTTPFGGPGVGGLGGTYSGSAATGYGSGGAGAGIVNSVGASGWGGSSGAYIKAIITNPNSTYAYAVGAAGAGGASNGGAGGSGVIIVTEYYANGAVGTATNVTGIVGTANGGTGSSTFHGNYYAQVIYPASGANYWSNTNASLANFTAVGTIPTPTAVVNSNMGTVSKATSSLPGISFVAPRTGTIRVNCRAFAYDSSGAVYALQLQETTTSTTLDTSGSGSNSTTLAYPTTMMGYLSVVAGTTYNLNILGQTNSGTLYIANGNLSNLAFWLEYIN